MRKSATPGRVRFGESETGLPTIGPVPGMPELLGCARLWWQRHRIRLSGRAVARRAPTYQAKPDPDTARLRVLRLIFERRIASARARLPPF
jgi:hypothetical protein